MKLLKKQIRRWLQGRGWALLPLSEVAYLGWEKTKRQRQAHDELVGLPSQSFCSQLGQDYLALSLFGTQGYFVEFGACDGVVHSNTRTLATAGWKGILAEPDPQWWDRLEQNRPESIRTQQCVWKESGKTLEFTSASDGVLSTLSRFEDGDQHARKALNRQQVDTISLLDLLKQHEAPAFIEFLSIDTEGSELDILEAFDFEQYSFGLICVEHNYTPMRHGLHKLLRSKGYIRVMERQSQWDDWYLHPSVHARTTPEALEVLI